MVLGMAAPPYTQECAYTVRCVHRPLVLRRRYKRKNKIHARQFVHGSIFTNQKTIHQEDKDGCTGIFLFSSRAWAGNVSLRLTSCSANPPISSVSRLSGGQHNQEIQTSIAGAGQIRQTTRIPQEREENDVLGIKGVPYLVVV